MQFLISHFEMMRTKLMWKHLNKWWKG